MLTLSRAFPLPSSGVLVSTFIRIRTMACSSHSDSTELNPSANISDQPPAVTPDEVRENLKSVQQRVQNAFLVANPDQKRSEGLPRLVAVSKTKPLELIKACYDAGQRDFGENYVQELLDKANSPIIQEECPDIRWHLIGALQSNKVTKVVNSMPRLCIVETVGSRKLAEMLNKGWLKGEDVTERGRLGVMVQVNTSGEEQKSGLSENEAIEVADFILDDCDGLEFKGFMTIGALAHSIASPTSSVDEGNPDFSKLTQVRRKFCAKKGIDFDKVELSMGMSNDFEEAIRMGSTNVRIGSTIFGARAKKTT